MEPRGGAGGITNGSHHPGVSSLGSPSYQPLLVFYRSNSPVSLLSELKGKRLSIGPFGSGTRTLALVLLKLNGIEQGGDTTLLDLDGEEASRALLAGAVRCLLLPRHRSPAAATCPI